MNVRTTVGLAILATLVSTAAAAQPPASPPSNRHVDPVNGLSLDQAIARALGVSEKTVWKAVAR